MHHPVASLKHFVQEWRVEQLLISVAQECRRSVGDKCHSEVSSRQNRRSGIGVQMFCRTYCSESVAQKCCL